MTIGLTPDAELDFSSSAFPGGTLLASVYDRVFMQLSDRGGASNLVGDRWANLCAEALRGHRQPHSDLWRSEEGAVADVSVRLDDIPEIAHTASRHKLQNPDFLMLGDVSENRVLWAADAKFSVDTARSKQVSGDVVRALLELGETVRRLVPGLDPDVVIHDGVFLCPDYALTHRLLRDRRGPRRTTVRHHEVRLIDVTSNHFLQPLGQEGLRQFFAELDALPIDPGRSLMLGLYYFRLARGALGCWQDQTAPLLTYRDAPLLDEAAIEDEARALTTRRTSAWGLVQRWNDVADEVRRQRTAVDHVTSLPINGKQLREQVLLAAAVAAVTPPSGTRVRRAIGSWYRSRIREQFGPIHPPVRNFGALLEELGAYSRSLYPEVAQVTKRVIDEMVAEATSVSREPISPK
ncbi:MAG: hypothetical protein M3457_01080 [Chloroflexota bacterium]|nr:hypothetical protein [Chloroflexota bacterium]